MTATALLVVGLAATVSCGSSPTPASGTQTQRELPAVSAAPLPPLGPFTPVPGCGDLCLAIPSPYFQLNEASLSEDATRMLAPIAHSLRLWAGRIRITGYTDGTGTASYNKELSRRRAQEVANWAVAEAGVAPGIVDVVGAGSVGARADLEDASKRRVEIALEP